MSKPLASDLAKYRDNPAAIAKYLAEAFDSGDLGAVVFAINAVMRAQNVAQLAVATGLRRECLYKTFGGSINPQLGRVMELFVGMDVALTVKAVPPSPKPPRPQLGRPSSSKRLRASKQDE